ncbi:MAG: SRPBCC family protein [Planctomycetota bacterium]
MHTELSIEIDAPIDQVFAKTNDDVTAWSRTCVDLEVLEERPEVVGSRSRITTEDRGQRMDFESVVEEWLPPRRSRVYLTGKAFDIDVTYRFEDLGGRTRVTQDSTIHGRGGFKLFMALFGWLMKRQGCKAQTEELQSLKAYCETGTPSA